MKKQPWFLSLLLLFSLALTGCGIFAETEKEQLEPLNAAAWPTSVPPTSAASPTPFPQVKLIPVTTPTPSTATAVTEDNVVEAELVEQPQTASSTAEPSQTVAVISSNEGNSVQTNPTAPQAEPVSFNSDSAQGGSPSSALAGLEVVTAARIAKNEVYVRPGPNTDYAAIDKLTDDQEQLSVLALDFSAQWALVQPTFSKTGWVALDDLTVAGHDLADAPQVFTAWVESNAVEVRSGPGIFHDQTGQLAINSLVRVLGLDESRSWALIQPVPDGSLGWSPIQFLEDVGQPWASVPQAPDLPAPTQVTATVEPFTPARPVSESKIVFQRSSGGDIMVINPDGSGLRRLTGGIDPVLSPDGQTAAFTRWQGENGSLWLINIDGSDERQVLGFIKQAKGPDWSPDGTRIVLNFQHGGQPGSTHRCTDLTQDSPASPPRNATDIKGGLDENGEPQLCWTLPPDPHWGLRVIDVADGSFEDVDGGTYAFRPAWDPGQPWRIVSDGGQGLLAVDLNQDNRQNLTNEVNDGSPVFSPDGRYLVVATGNDSGAGYDLYRLNADGSGRIQLTQTPLWVTSEPGEAKAWNNVAPAWSPDASQIAFLTDRTGRWEVWVMNPDGSNPQPIFSDEINAQLHLEYNFVDERILSWR